MDEITANFEPVATLEAAPLRFRLRTQVAAKSDLGRVRENNEDKFEYYLPEEDAVLVRRGHAYLVCDGMGGHAAGQIASELAAKTFLGVYYDHPSPEVEVAARSAVQAAHRFVTDVGRAVPSRRGMGTTLSALLMVEDRAWLVQVGDSRIYRLRAGILTQLSQDHTYADEMVRQGLMSAEEAKSSPYAHALTRAIGGEGDFEADVESFDLQPGDLYLLCSDGLVNHVPDARILERLQQPTLSAAAWDLVQDALADGGSDNCTVLLVRVDELERV
ncbi:MAG TPA: protein phosphatase 2C domain-containing protein [Fimbriimonadaceae bacterium]|nr:protein phosphatase 2C domain-containing protein [Fimbriimonadaceae bacterium]HRJ34086.1 protein phosphatase 2C domain-containing protein [Fimbriimonadaceae bacterium]